MNIKSSHKSWKQRLDEREKEESKVTNQMIKDKIADIKEKTTSVEVDYENNLVIIQM